MRPSPVILTGPRSDRGTPGRAKQSEVSHPGLYSRISALMRGRNLIPQKKEKTPYEVIFASKYSRLRVQVTAPEDEVVAKTGRKIQSRPIAVQFDRSVYSVPKKYTTAQAEDILGWLRAHPQFGPGKDFWEQKDVLNEALVRQTVHVIEEISNKKPMREAVLEFLSRGDFFDDETTLGAQVIDDPEEPEESGDEDDEDEVTEDEPEPTPVRRGRGRPKGSKNKRKK